MGARSEMVPGSQLGRYELLTPIAQGGMAAVWAARQTGSHGFKKTVALKTMLPALSDDAQFEQMFLAESRNAMRVHHPNVVEILDLGEQNGLVYLVMEWVDGESLSTLVKASEKRGTTIPLRLGVHVCQRASLGLHAAHEVTDEDDNPLGLVHRDVSPQNIMVTYDGHVKVVDFGVAKSHVEASATLTGQFKGKIPYMSPEQAQSDRVDRRSDIFSMGIMLYRVTTGVHPFGGTNQISTLHNILHSDPTPPTQLDPSFPVDLEAVILRCLSKERNSRFASMADVARSLDLILSHLGGPVTEQELSTLVKTNLNEVRVQRRAAMRVAARSLGWAVATSESLPRVSLPASMSLTPSAPTMPQRSHYSLTPSQTAAATVMQWAPQAPKPKWMRNVAIAATITVATIGGVFCAQYFIRSGGSSVQGTSSVNAGESATSQPTAGVGEASPMAASSHTAPTHDGAGSATSASATSASAAATPQAKAVRGAPARPASPPPHTPTGTPTSWGAGPDLGF